MVEPFYERIVFIYHIIVSKVHGLHSQHPHSQPLSKLNQIVYLLVGRTSTRQGDSNAHKIIVLRPVDPEKIHAEL